MSTKIFYTQIELLTYRKIREVSKKSNNVQELKKNLEKHGIKTNFSFDHKGKVQNLSFEKESFKMNSVKGIDRTYTDRIVNTLDKNREKLQQNIQKEMQQKPNRFDEIRANRDLKTQMERQPMYNTKSMKR